MSAFVQNGKKAEEYLMCAAFSYIYMVDFICLTRDICENLRLLGRFKIFCNLWFLERNSREVMEMLG